MILSGIRRGVLIGFLFLNTSAFCQTAGSITGNWKFELKDKPLEMEIYRAKDSAYYGKIINDTSKPSKDGTIVLKKLIYNRGAQNFKGTMRPHDANIELDVTITEIDQSRLKAVAKKLLVSKIVYLTRIK